MSFLSFGDQLCQYVAAQVPSAALTYGTNLFSGRLQDKPDAQAAIWVGGGAIPPAVLDGQLGATLLKVDEPTVQVIVRGTLDGYVAAETLIYAIYKVLQSLNNVTLVTNGLVVKTSWPLQNPAYLGRDDVERHLFSQNFRFLVENSNR